jgi:hypothetical protein
MHKSFGKSKHSMKKEEHREQEHYMPEHHDEVDEDAYDQALSVLAVNEMSYTLPLASSNASSRQIQQFLFSPPSFDNIGQSSSAQLILNTGNYYINGPTSTLQFSVKVNVAASPAAGNFFAWSFGDSFTATKTPLSGSSACNLFREASIISRSGEVLQRNLYANVLSAATANYVKGEGFANLMAESGGASYEKQYNGYHFPIYDIAQEVYFEIPLSRLLSFFAEAAPIPSLLASGSKITLNFDNILNAITLFTLDVAYKPADGNPIKPTAAMLNNITVAGAGLDGAISANIKNMQVMMDCNTIFDNSQMLISASSQSLQTSGLQYCYYNTFQTRTNVQNTSATVDILLSAAKLKYILARYRSAVAPSSIVDNMASLPMRGTGGLGTSVFVGSNADVGLIGSSSSLRARIGSDLLSLLPISNAGQLYRQSCTALVDAKGGLVGGVDANHNKNKPFDVNVSLSDYAYNPSGAFLACWDCEKSANLSISGMQSNNSRAIQIEQVGTNASGGNNIIADYFVVFLSCANTTSENTVVDK